MNENIPFWHIPLRNEWAAGSVLFSWNRRTGVGDWWRSNGLAVVGFVGELRIVDEIESEWALVKKVFDSNDSHFSSIVAMSSYVGLEVGGGRFRSWDALDIRLS